MKPKVIVGQRLYSLNVGNNARHREQVLTPVVVSKVGRKYFTVKTEGQYALETEYRIEDWRENHEYCANSALYETEQEWADEKETRAICEKIWKAFEYGHNRQNLNLETLRTIAAAIHPNDRTLRPAK